MPTKITLMKRTGKRLAIFLRANAVWIGLAAAIVVGSFMRFYNLGAKSLYADEALYWQRAVTHAAGGHFDVVTDIHVYFYLLSQIVQVSASEFSLRLVSALPGVAAIPLFYLVLRKFMGSTGALVGTGLYAVSPFLIVVAQTVREHTLYLFFVISLIYFFLNYLTETRTWDLIAFAVLSVLAIFTHISAAWVILALGFTYLWIFIFYKDRRDRKQFIGFASYAVFIVLVVVGFWVLGYSSRAGWESESYLEHGHYWAGTIPSFFNLVFGNLWNLLVGAVSEQTVALAILAILLAISYGLLKGGRKSETIFLVATFPLLITIGTSLVRLYPFIGAHRNNIYLVLGVYLLAGLGFEIMAKINKTIFGFALALMLVFLTYDAWGKVNQPSLQELRPIAETLCEEIESGDQIFAVSASSYAFDYYWPQCASPLARGSQAIPVVYFGLNATGALGELVQFGDHRAWMVLSFLNNNELNRILQSVEGMFGEPAALVQEENGAWLYLLPN
ncbi:MAG: glycosyltransferase family 39 protein [Anaerolineales bacterium]